MESMPQRISKVYLSIDSAVIDDPLDIIHLADHQTENLNAINCGSLPLHRLVVKFGCIVMLLRNLSVKDGLCNGTRLVVDELSDNLIYCKILLRNGNLSTDRWLKVQL